MLLFVSVVIGTVALIIWLDAPRVERERLQKFHEEQVKLHETKEHLLDRRLIRQIYAKIQTWDNEDQKNERLLDREILRSIYAQQKFPLFNNDGLQIKPFAQGILKQFSKLNLC